MNHNGSVYSIKDMLDNLVPNADGKSQKKIKGMPNVPELIALVRQVIYATNPDSALSSCQRASLDDPNLFLIFLCR